MVNITTFGQATLDQYSQIATSEFDLEAMVLRIGKRPSSIITSDESPSDSAARISDAKSFKSSGWFTQSDAFDNRSPSSVDRSESSPTIEAHFEDAWRLRELAAAMLDNDGLGLHILVTLRDSGFITADDLAASITESPARLATCLARLMKFGAVALDDSNRFGCTESGASMVSSIEAKSGISFSLTHEAD